MLVVQQHNLGRFWELWPANWFCITSTYHIMMQRGSIWMSLLHVTDTLTDRRARTHCSQSRASPWTWGNKRHYICLKVPFLCFCAVNMTDREARSSTDEGLWVQPSLNSTIVLFCSIERDSLLRDPAEGASRSLGERVNIVAQEPLTPLTKTLLILALVLLLTSSVCLKHAHQAPGLRGFIL